MPQLTDGCCTLDFDTKRIERDITLTDTRRKRRLSIGGTSASATCSLSARCFVGFKSVWKRPKLQALGKVTAGSGFTYTDELTGNTMVEYHVDTCKEFMHQMNKAFGGNVSVRSNPEKRPLIVFGQDECIVKQYSFTHKSWNRPNREQALIPKMTASGDDLSFRFTRVWVWNGAYKQRTPTRERSKTRNEVQG
ncbi:hypothetical protein MHU86_687 [Fragilaria crotonensis]|nr:hypothetical protein MHU86_687 [Fragilaria crotonensis]